MSDFQFDSPSVKLAERDLTFATPQAPGSTAVGFVGETLKGPAFQPIVRSTKSDFRRMFGGQSPEKMGDGYKYLLPYYADSYLDEGNQLYVVRVLGLSGYDAGKGWAITINSTANPGASFADNMVVAVIRSRGQYIPDSEGIPQLQFRTTDLSAVADGVDPLGFTISSPQWSETYKLSLDPDSISFITKVLGKDAKNGTAGVYVETVFPELLKRLLNAETQVMASFRGLSLLEDIGDYRRQFVTPETPWVVSELRGNQVVPLYKFVSISDGASANQEIKISHENMNPVTKDFDVLIRDFNDTDDNVIILERYTKVNLNPKSVNFIARRIGAVAGSSLDADFDIVSTYVYMEMADHFPEDAIPCGFEGYTQPKLSLNGGGALTQPKMLFKTSYENTDRVGRTYLGISERAYDGNKRGRGIDPDFFQFRGETSASNTVRQKGFHLDSGATGNYSVGSFNTGLGQLRTFSDTQSGVYADVRSRKFTMVPAGGFDGWDVFRDSRTTTDGYQPGGPLLTDEIGQASDFNAYMAGIKKMGNSEETPISLLATPGLNWMKHSSLIRETLDLVERKRQDCLYVIDAPDLGSGDGVIEDLVGLFDIVDIDSSYTTTMAPHIQIEDVDNNMLVYIPPTGEAIRIMAYTDRVAGPWWAPAGLKRGVMKKAKRTRIKLDEDMRDKLYVGRINPIADFRDVGVDLFGQKTTQRANSSLDRISIRRMLLHAKAMAKQIARKIQFEQNDDIVRSQFLTEINPKLRKIQTERGLTTFKVVEAESPEGRARLGMFFVLKLQAVDSLENVGLTFELTNNTAVFQG